MKGTWQTTSGGGGAAVGVIVLGVVIVAAVEFILSVIIWIAAALGVLLAVAAAVLVWWVRGRPARQAAWDARYAAAFDAERNRRAVPKVTATVIPQVSTGAWPAIESHVIHHHVWEGPAEREAVQIVRAAIPGKAGDAFTEGGNT